MRSVIKILKSFINLNKKKTMLFLKYIFNFLLYFTRIFYFIPSLDQYNIYIYQKPIIML